MMPIIHTPYRDGGIARWRNGAMHLICLTGQGCATARAIVLFLIWAAALTLAWGLGLRKSRAAEVSLEAGLSNTVGSLLLGTVRLEDFSPVSWLDPGIHLARIERSGESFTGVGADVRLGYEDIDPDVLFSFGATYFDRRTGYLDTHLEYKVALTLGWNGFFAGLQHWSNGGGFPFGDCHCPNTGENFVTIGYRIDLGTAPRSAGYPPLPHLPAIALHTLGPVIQGPAQLPWATGGH